MRSRIAAGLLAAAAAVPLLAAFAFKHRPYAVPPSSPTWKAGALRLRYTGITGYELSDGKTTILLDPVVTRPEIWRLPLGPLRPDAALSARVFPRADFILIDHAHFDHAVDMPDVAKRTGAVVVGSESAARLARAQGVPQDKIKTVAGGETLRLGTFTVSVRRSRHAPILGVREPMSGLAPDEGRPLWFHEYRQDAALTYHLRSPAGSVWFHPTSTFAPGELAGLEAATLIFGVTGVPWTESTLAAVAAESPGVKVLLPSHYDNFFQPRARGLALMPGLDLEALRALAARVVPGAAFAVLDYDQTLALP